jgi:cation/acetate symporter
MRTLWVITSLFIAFPISANAQTALGVKHGPNWIAIGMFLLIVVVTLAITYRSSGSTKSKVDFYTAGHGITPLQNGLAIAGDFLSAAAFQVYSTGFDGLVYALGFLTGWPIVLFLMSERLRNLGSFTFADAASFRLDRTSVRLVAATGSLVVVLFYLVAQMIGAGKARSTPFWCSLYLCNRLRWRLDDRLCHGWRNAGNHLGADYQGRPAAGGRHPDGLGDTLAF